MLKQPNEKHSGQVWTINSRFAAAIAEFPHERAVAIVERCEHLAGFGCAPTADEAAAVFADVPRADLLILARIYASFDRRRLLEFAEFGESHPHFEEDRRAERLLGLYEAAMSCDNEPDDHDDSDAIGEVAAAVTTLIGRQPKAELASEPEEPTNCNAPKAETISYRPRRRWTMPASIAACLPLVLLLGVGWGNASRSYHAEYTAHSAFRADFDSIAAEVGNLRAIAANIATAQNEAKQDVIDDHIREEWVNRMDRWLDVLLDRVESVAVQCESIGE